MSARRYREASGRSFLDCAALGYLDGDRSAVVLVKESPGSPMPVELGVRCVVPTLLTGLWRADDGTVFTADRHGFVRWNADPWRGDSWQQQELDLVFHGVVGENERHVWAFGVRSSDGASLLRRFDGREWKAVAAPGFGIAAMAVGRRVWCAGEGGHLARFDGTGWTLLQLADGLDLVALHAGPAGVVAAASDGSIRVVPDDDDSDQVRVLGTVPVRPHAVAIWAGAVWVGAGELGLWRLVDGRAACVRADRACRSLDARHDLLVGCDDVISGTSDGARFPATGRGFLDGT